MKKLLFNFLMVCGLVLVGVEAMAQPVINYPGNTTANNYTFPTGVAIATQTPTNTGAPVGSFGAINSTWVATRRGTSNSGGIFYDAKIGAFYSAEYTYGQLDKITLAGVSSNLNGGLPGSTGYCIVTDANGTVYFSDGTSVLEFTTNTGTNVRTITGFSSVAGMALDGSNNLYVVDAGTSKIYKCALAATTAGTAIISGLNNPWGIAISGNNIFITQYGATLATQGVFEIVNGVTGSTAVTSYLPETTVNSLPFKTPHNLTFDANGNLYVADFSNAKIEVISTGATPALTNLFTGLGTTPDQITFDPTGIMYFGDISSYWKKSIGTYYTYTGTILPGLSLNPYTGAITGTPTSSGPYSIVVTAASTSGNSTPVTVNFNCTVTATNLTTLTTPAAVNYGQTNIATAGISLVSNGSTPLTQLVFNVAEGYSTLENYFGVPALYTNTSTTWGLGTPSLVTPASVTYGTNTITYNFTSATVGTTATNYFLVFGYSNNGTPLPQAFNFKPTGYTTGITGAVTTAYSNNTYTCTPPTITATDNTAGLTSPTAVYSGQTNIAVAGITMSSNFTTPISQLVFNVAEGYTAYQGYFGTPTLVTCTGATYSSASSSPVTYTTSFSGTTLTYNFSAVNLTTANKYFFLVINYSVAGGAVPQAFNFSPSTYTTAAGLVTTGYGNNTYTCSPPTVTATNLTTLTSPTAVYYAQTNIATAGISLVSNGSTPLTQLVFNVAEGYSTLENYFGVPALYTNTSTTWGSGTPSLVTPSSVTYGTNTITYNFTSATVGTTATNYFLVFNYSINGTPLPQAFNFSPTGYTTGASGAVTTGYGNNTYTCTPPTVTATNLTTLTSPIVYYGQTNIATAGISLVASASTPLTQLVFNVAEGYSTLENYFGVPALYTNTSTTWGSGTSSLVTPASVTYGTNTITYNFTSATVGTTATNYFLVFGYNTNGTPLPQAFNFSPSTYTTSAGTVTTGYGNNTYTCTAPTITATNLTNLTSPTAVLYGQTNIATAGISLMANVSTPLTQLVFNVAEGYSNLENYFGVPALYTNTTTTWGTGTRSAVTPASVTYGTNSITYNFTSATVGTTATNYFLVFNYSTNGTPLPQAFNFSPSTYTTSAGFVTTGYGNNTYTCTPPTITATDNTAGLTSPAAVYSGQANIAVAGITMSANATTPISQLVFNVAEGYTTYQGYFGIPTLVTCPTSTYSSGTATAVATSSTSFSGTALTYNFSAVNLTTANKYFFLVINYSVAGGALPQSFNFSPSTYTTSAGLVSTGYGNNTYTCTAPTVTATDLTTGLTSGPAVYYGQTNLGVAGISFSVNASSTSLTQLVFTVPQGLSTATNYFATPTLVTCPTATYSSASATPVTPASTSFSGTTATLNLSSYTIGTSNVYFFLVLNYTVAGGAVPQTFTFSPTSFTTTASGTVSTGYAYNTYTCTAPILTQNINTTGLAANPISGNQTNIAVYGMSLTSTGTSSVTSLAFNASQIIVNYFPSVSLYSSTSPTFALGTASLITTQTSPASPATSITFSGLSLNVANGTTVYYYLVVSYTETSATPPASFQFTLATSGITSTSTVNYNTTAGTVYIFQNGQFDWVGGSGGSGATRTNWNLAANWVQNAVPGQYDVANFGVNYNYSYEPVVKINTTVGSILYNANDNSGGDDNLTINTGVTLTVNGDINLVGDLYASAIDYQNVIFLLGSGTIQAANLNVNATYYYGTGYGYPLEFIADGPTFKLSGNMNISSNYDGSTHEYPYVVFEAGTTTLTGTINTTNPVASAQSIIEFYIPSAGTVLQLANANALSGLSSTGTNTVNFNVANGTVEYSGAAQTVYTDFPITGLSPGPSYYGLKFSGNGIKTPNGTSANSLFVAGDFTNALTTNDAADYIKLKSTIVNFNGTVNAQNMYAGNGTGTTFTNLIFSGTKTTTIGSGNAYIASNGLLTMGTSATCKLATGGFLTLNADATGCAAVAPITTTTPISGAVNVQRYISGVRGYRLLSSPVYTGNTGVSGTNNVYSLNYLAAHLYLTGSVTGTGGFPYAGNPTLYLYDESFLPKYTSFLNSNYIGIASFPTTTTPAYLMNANGSTSANGLVSTSTGYTIPVSNGYLCFFRGDLSQGQSALTTPGVFATETPSTITAVGTLNQGQITFKEWYSPTVTTLGSKSQDYNLIGNPYASAIDLNTIQSGTTTTGIYATALNGGGTTGIESFVYELIPSGQYKGQYGIWTVGGSSSTATSSAIQYIASGEGFLVRAHGTSTLIFNEGAKATSTNANSFGIMARRMDVAALNPQIVNPLLRLKIASDTSSAEETLIRFNPAASTKYVLNEDAPHKAGSGLVHLASRSSDSVAMAINTVPLLQSQTIPLNVSAANDGVYSISLEQAVPLPALYDMWLMDAYKKDSLDIKNNPTYSFDIANADTNSFGTRRFSLVIRQNPALMVHLLNFAATKVVTGDQVLWTTENEANYTNFVVQRSTDGGKTFTNLDGFLSSALGNYTYLDRTPVLGANSYRLQLTDLNGTVTYSAVVTIMYANTNNQIATNGMIVYPNPTVGVVNLAINSNQAVTTGVNGSLQASYNIEIVNNLGSVIKTATSSSANWQTDVSGLLPGTYFIQVTDANKHTVVGKTAFVRL